MIQNKFWKNKRVLITGIDGFVGSNLAKKLIRLEAKVYGIVQKKKNSLLYFESIHKKCKLFKGEITNKTFIDQRVGKNNFEIVAILHIYYNLRNQLLPKICIGDPRLCNLLQRWQKYQHFD